jgi:hypothetical protein
MRIGEYRIVIQDVNGDVLAEVERTAATGHPAVGEEIALDGCVYVVERVRHEDDPDARASRRYTAPSLFVRRRDGFWRGRRKDAARATRVLPFGGSRRRRLRGVSSVILPPQLVAAVVAAGYDAQMRHFHRRSRGAARLSRLGQGWFVAAGESPAEAKALAREACKQRRRVERFWCRMASLPCRYDLAPRESSPSIAPPTPSLIASSTASSAPAASALASPAAPAGSARARAIFYVLDGADDMNLVHAAHVADCTLAGDLTDDDATSSASCEAPGPVRAAARSPPASS